MVWYEKMRALDYDKIRKDIVESPKSSSIYIGCDSRDIGGISTFGLVVIIHLESSKGGRCYTKKYREERKLSMRERLLKEVELSVNCAFEIQDVIGSRNFELHLDINPKVDCGSNVVIGQATGYVSAQGFNFKVKPNAFAASTAADYILN